MFVLFGEGEAISYNLFRQPKVCGHMKRRSILILMCMTLPLFTSQGGIIPTVHAESSCAGTVSNVEWNKTLQRHALVPFSNYDYMYYDGEVSEPMSDGKDAVEPGYAIDEISSTDPLLHPEEYWMYNPTWPIPTLVPLTKGQFVTMSIGNDSVGSLRLNLSSTQRTTFCISLTSLVGNESQQASADVYLMTSSQYSRYEELFRMQHGGYWYFDSSFGGDANSVLSEIPPEWRSFNPTGWQSYRDVHQYENVDQITFSVSLDAPEVYSSLFSGDNWEDFYLVIDTWDNTHDHDALPASTVIYADVTIIPSPRSAIFPAWSVPLFLFVFLVGAVVTPILLNKRYMEAGVGAHESNEKVAIPVLEQAISNANLEEN